jgi:molybdenum cofactor biosynthesis enzyme MoaA
VKSIYTSNLSGLTSLNFEVLQKAIEEAYDLGLEDVLIAGGEPLLERNLILKIIRLLNHIGVTCRLETNGTLVDQELARSL